MKSKSKYIECDCGLWEELLIDQKNSETTLFEWVTNNIDGSAIYTCQCGDTVNSVIKVKSDEEL